MEPVPNHRERIDFVIGSEMRIETILSAADVIPVLKPLARAGISFATVTDEKGRFLWTEGAAFNVGELQACVARMVPAGKPGGTEIMNDTAYSGAFSRVSPLYYEGEPIGFLFALSTVPRDRDLLPVLLDLVSASLNAVIRNNAKRLLTTELHTTVVNQSYEELLEKNRQLTISERKYRELSETLEKKVEERTAELKLAYTRLLQQEKMASIGQLAAGMAHEINNPIGFIYSNLGTFEKYTRSLMEMIGFYRKELRKIGTATIFDSQNGSCPYFPGDLLVKQSEELYKKLKLDFIMSDIIDLTQQSKTGAERIRNIVANLKGFSHVDEVSSGATDVNTELDKTLSVLSHEVAEKAAKVVKDYGAVPVFYGNSGLICQVFLNILLNALQSKDREPTITIRTRQRGDTIAVSISDDGSGIPRDHQDRIFEPFFTTKDVGKGMGMGLTVAYDIVTSHGGSIEVGSEPGKGSEFTISLPVKDDKNV